MKNLIIIIAIIFITISSAYPQVDNECKSTKFIERLSIGAGLGVQLPVGNYYTMKERNLLGDFTAQYKISKDFSAAFNISFENDNSVPVSYLNFSTRYRYLNYRNTLLPYFELGIGAYYGKELLAKDEVFMYYSERKSYFGGSAGTGLDLILSPYAALDLNVRYHSFNFDYTEHFFTVLSDIRFNL
jgi:hypothetical protein